MLIAFRGWGMHVHLPLSLSGTQYSDYRRHGRDWEDPYCECVITWVPARGNLGVRGVGGFSKLPCARGFRILAAGEQLFRMRSMPVKRAQDDSSVRRPGRVRLRA
jgi:hypothetical protein